MSNLKHQGIFEVDNREDFSKGDKVQLGDGSIGKITKKIERAGFSGYRVEITEADDPEQIGRTVGASPSGMKKISLMVDYISINDKVRMIRNGISGTVVNKELDSHRNVIYHILPDGGGMRLKCMASELESLSFSARLLNGCTGDEPAKNIPPRQNSLTANKVRPHSFSEVNERSKDAQVSISPERSGPKPIPGHPVSYSKEAQVDVNVGDKVKIYQGPPGGSDDPLHYIYVNDGVVESRLPNKAYEVMTSRGMVHVDGITRILKNAQVDKARLIDAVISDFGRSKYVDEGDIQRTIMKLAERLELDVDTLGGMVNVVDEVKAKLVANGVVIEERPGGTDPASWVTGSRVAQVGLSLLNRVVSRVYADVKFGKVLKDEDSITQAVRRELAITVGGGQDVDVNKLARTVFSKLAINKKAQSIVDQALGIMGGIPMLQQQLEAGEDIESLVLDTAMALGVNAEELYSEVLGRIGGQPISIEDSITLSPSESLVPEEEQKEFDEFIKD